MVSGMDAVRDDDTIIVRLDPGDSVIGSLKQLRDEYAIDSAFFTGIGAVDRATLGHYNVEDEDYREKTVEGNFEVTNFTGNIGPDKIHAHITLGKEDFTAIGGHCAAARVSGTFEIIVRLTDKPLKHRTDPETGLDVFDL